jgi:hypothetical protein
MYIDRFVAEPCGPHTALACPVETVTDPSKKHVNGIEHVAVEGTIRIDTCRRCHL